MLDSLQVKYGETFEMDSLSESPLLPPEYRSGRWRLVHPVDTPSEVFAVVPSDGAAGGWSDVRVLAGWGDQLRQRYSHRIESAFGTGADFHVQVGLPDAALLTPADIQRDPESLLASADRRSTVTFMVAVQVATTGADPSEWNEPILRVWRCVQEVGASNPELKVWFVDDIAGFDTFLRVRSVPGMAVPWDADPAVIAMVDIDKNSGVSSTADISRRVFRPAR